MKRIKIKKVFADDHISRAAGERLRFWILENTKDATPVQVDFENMVIASTSFFDEAFAKLAEENWTQEQFKSLVKIQKLNPMDQEVLEYVCHYRKLL